MLIPRALLSISIYLPLDPEFCVSMIALRMPKVSPKSSPRGKGEKTRVEKKGSRRARIARALEISAFSKRRALFSLSARRD